MFMSSHWEVVLLIQYEPISQKYTTAPSVKYTTAPSLSLIPQKYTIVSQLLNSMLTPCWFPFFIPLCFSVVFPEVSFPAGLV